MPQLIWRIEGASDAPNTAGWQQGLTLHLLFQAITTVVVCRDGATRHYLALEGCPHCRLDGCDRVCPRTLFAQLAQTTLPGVRLIPVRQLARRVTECRRLVAVPRRVQTRLLDAEFLSQWREGHLTTTWSRLQAKPQPIMVGAALVVGAGGPDPARTLMSAGWRIPRLANLSGPRAAQLGPTTPVKVGARADEALFAALREPHRLWGAPAALASEERHA